MDDELTPVVWPNGDQVDFDSIEAYAEDARRVAESNLDDGVVRGPDWVIAELELISAHAARMVLVIMNAETLKRRTATKLARAKANARIAHARKVPTLQTAHIVVDTAELQDEYDVAVAAFEYARRVGNLLAGYTTRVQSIGRQVEITYSLAGAGRGR
ncbi:hypothetical protein [Microbacterium sp. NPDC089696]|uniref:hypothetical protein n=1 Tax=Microbacterium sp. NPDC089696 TaxID=3364199 RepID=UPI003818D327